MAEDWALDVEELDRHLKTDKIPEIETEEIQSICDDIEQEEDASSRVVPGIEERFVDPSLNAVTVRKTPADSKIGKILKPCFYYLCFIACCLCLCFIARRRKFGSGRNDIKQEKEALSRIPRSVETDDIEIKPSEVTNCGEHKNVIDSEGRSSMPHSFPLTEIKTPMGNTVLHIAARNGKVDVVDIVVKRAPDLLFSFNKNKDSALHVAARAGHIRTVKKLLAAYTSFERPEIAEAWAKYKRSQGSCIGMPGMLDLLELVIKENDQGNTVLHEAMICGKSVGAMISKAFEPCNIQTSLGKWESMLEHCKEYAFTKNNNAKQSVLYLAVEAADKKAVELILDKCPNFRKPVGLSPVVASIMKRDKDMLSIILRMKPDWIHLADTHGRLPLHYAASTGYFEGVDLLLGKCKCCSIRRDKYGFFPLHLASHEGHVEVVKKLLDYCLDPTEMLDNSGHVEVKKLLEYCPVPTEMLDNAGHVEVKKLLEYCPVPTEMVDNSQRNILHIAAKSGKHEVVRYILRTPKLHEMINQKDNKGDTPLHLATRSCHPKTVYYLTWDDRVDLTVVNQKNETALDIVNALYQHDNSSMGQQFTWIALKSAGAKPSSSRVLPLESRSSDSKPIENSAMERNNDKVSNQERFKDRVETLTVVSTLIITSSVAACLAVPGEADGTANNLYHAMFPFFISCITLSFFSSVSATIILFWARLGLIELLDYSLKIAMPLLGVALISLSLAFLAGVYTVISKLHWLATTFVVMTVIFVVVVFLLYILLFLPSTSTNTPLRYISYYPFLFLASLAEPKTNQGAKF